MAVLTKNELRQKILLANEDLSLENPVDLKVFAEIKLIRNKLKAETNEWVADYRKKFKKEPNLQDAEGYQDKLNEFNFYNKRYIVMKAKLIRQDKFDL